MIEFQRFEGTGQNNHGPFYTELAFGQGLRKAQKRTEPGPIEVRQ